MKGWLFLVIAIVGEVIATSALKSSEGFTKLAPVSYTQLTLPTILFQC
ncbi:SMR family transporter, partial [Escherichia coli]